MLLARQYEYHIGFIRLVWTDTNVYSAPTLHTQPNNIEASSLSAALPIKVVAALDLTTAAQHKNAHSNMGLNYNIEMHFILTTSHEISDSST